MIPSPFHGIFSSLAANEHAKKASAKTQVKEAEPAPSRAGDVPIRSSSSVGQVALDIFEHDAYYIIRAPIAGVRLSDIDIEINDCVLTIRGTRKLSDEVPTERYYLQECFWGPFERSVTLPCSIDPRRVKATLNKESVLKIIVPKEERIKIVRVSE